MTEPVPRVKTAWTDPEHMRLVYDLEERRNPRHADRVRGIDPSDPWATGPTACPDCWCDPYEPQTLGSHAGAACVNPSCPAGCNEVPGA